jgi:hypothetical protein
MRVGGGGVDILIISDQHMRTRRNRVAVSHGVDDRVARAEWNCCPAMDYQKPGPKNDCRDNDKIDLFVHRKPPGIDQGNRMIYLLYHRNLKNAN